jgi:hypothetical protein
VVNYLTSEGLSVDSDEEKNYAAKEEKRVSETQGSQQERQVRKR